MQPNAVTVSQVEVAGRRALGVRVELPASPPMLVIVADKGFLMCGYLNVDAAEKLGVVAAAVSGVRTFDDMLRAEVRAVTSKARELGIREGVRGSEALELMMG